MVAGPHLPLSCGMHSSPSRRHLRQMHRHVSGLARLQYHLGGAAYLEQGRALSQSFLTRRQAKQLTELGGVGRGPKGDIP